MSFVATAIVLAVVWTAVTGSVTLANLVLGIAIAALALLFLRDRFPAKGGLHRALRLAALGVVFLRELLLSAISVGILTLRPNVRKSISPAIIAFPLTVTRDIEITLLANLITLTPGTLSLDVSPDKKLLYVHALNCESPDALKRSIAEGFERSIIEAFR